MRRLPLLLVLALVATMPVVGGADPTVVPQAVVALIDTGINPYSPAFRADPDDELAWQHPSTYIPGYPEDALALPLSLNEASYEAAVAKDFVWWELLFVQNALYYIPGTRIVGLISLGSGGAECAHVPPVPPASQVNGFFCAQKIGLDDAGHGTMTASRAVGWDPSAALPRSLGAGARVVMIEGLGAPGVLWAAGQEWIDVQSNSWGTLAPAPPGNENSEAFKEAVEDQLVLTASGNGIAFSGVAPTPTITQPTMPAGVIMVGAHDNGHVSAWSGAPAHVVTDGYGGYSATHRTLEQMAPRPIACCTSAASPYAAGGAAAIALEARRILGDPATGVRDGIVAQSPTGITVASGPLDDGVLTLTEWTELFLRTAEALPAEGRDDGLLHFTGSCDVETQSCTLPQNPQHGTGENPFCQFCWTLPMTWDEYPSNGLLQPYELIGYGAVNERSVDLAGRVLRGETELPDRSEVDAFFEEDQQRRRTVYGP